VFYRVTLQSEAGTTYTHTIPQGFPYQSWWKRLPEVFKDVVIAACALGAYLGFCFLVLWLRPIVVLHLYTPVQEHAGKLPSPVSPMVPLAATCSLSPSFSPHTRVPAAWPTQSQPGQNDLGALPPAIRADFISRRIVSTPGWSAEPHGP